MGDIIPEWKYGATHRLYRRYCTPDALAIRHRFVRHVYPAVQSGSHSTRFSTVGIALGISPYMLIAMFPAVNGYFFIPNYPTVVAAINFDRTITTRIGKYILNHSFMMPGIVSTARKVELASG